MSTVIERSALLFYSAEQMYDLVNDVASYPLFLDNCVAANIVEQSEAHMVAHLVLQKAGISLGFTTRNGLERPTRIDMQLEDGPFSKFAGCWRFTPLREGACKVSLDIEFVVDKNIVSKLASGLFDALSRSLVDTFCKRAEDVYGSRVTGSSR